MKRSMRPLFLAALIGTAAAVADAGDRTNIQGVGMARTASAVARGFDAVGINPANLGFGGEGRITLGIVPLGLRVGNDVFDYSLYRRTFAGVETDNGRVGIHLTDADKGEILGRFPDGNGHGLLDVEVRPFGFTIEVDGIGNFAGTMTDRVSGTMGIPEEYLRFLFYGNPPGSSYDLSGSRLEISWLREYALSYARPIPELFSMKSLFAGISLKLVHGFSYYGVDRFAARLHTSSSGVLDGSVDLLTRHAGVDPTAADFAFRPFPAPAGVGYGVDLGVSGEVNELLRVGLGLTDVGSVHWSRGLRENAALQTIHLDRITDQAQKDSLDAALQGEQRPGEPFRTALPTTLRLGAAIELHRLPAVGQILAGELTVAADYIQGLVEVPGTTTVPRGSLGLEYRPWPFLPLRTGVGFGAGEGTAVALGFGLHTGVFDLDLATESLGWLVSPESSGTGSAALGMRFRF